MDDSMELDLALPASVGGADLFVNNNLPATTSVNNAGQQTFRVSDLSADVLKVWSQYLPEYSWEEQERAPVPPKLAPLSLFVRVGTSRSVLTAATGEFYGASQTLDHADNDNADETLINTNGKRTRSSRHKKAAVHLGRPVPPLGEWQTDTFPFGHAPHYPPKPIEPLLLTTQYRLRSVTEPDQLYEHPPMYQLPDYEPPLTSVIYSPYVRIPPYSFCARTSINWRTNPILRTRCHMSFLPYFGEDNYEDENDFRERIEVAKGRIAFRIPTEDPGNSGLEEPDNRFCGICLSRGCIVHHHAPAVPLPVETARKPTFVPKFVAPTLSRSQSSNSNSGSRAMSARYSFMLPTRVEPVGRNATTCGRNCYRSSDTVRSIVPYEQWSHQSRDDFDLVRRELRPDTSACTVAAFLHGRACYEVHAALRNRPCMAVDSIPDANEAEPAQREIEPYFEAEDANAFTAEEIRARAPRTVQPWQPCYHPGRSCSSFKGTEDAGPDGLQPICTCRRNGTWCEPGCGCDLDCSERFPGCDCATRGKECKIKTDVSSGQTTGCICIEHMRECHRELCSGHRDNICKAMRFQSDNTVRTFVGPSDLEGYGLFSGEDVSSSRIHIGEYRGELINEHETSMRSLLYTIRARSFLFDLTKLGVVDGLRLGNKTRYINTRKQKSANLCGGQSTMINGEARLIITATKPDEHRMLLRKNEELTLDYGASYEIFGSQ